MAPFPNPSEYLKSRDTGYAMRLPDNAVFQRYIRHLLKRPLGRPPKACLESVEGKPVVWYQDLVYQAQSWEILRRLVTKSLP